MASIGGQEASGKGIGDSATTKIRTGKLMAGSTIPADVMAYRRDRLAEVIANVARKNRPIPAVADDETDGDQA